MKGGAFTNIQEAHDVLFLFAFIQQTIKRKDQV